MRLICRLLDRWLGPKCPQHGERGDCLKCLQSRWQEEYVEAWRRGLK